MARKMTRNNSLVRLFGFPATLIHGDTLVLDRWLWLRHRLRRLRSSGTTLIDIGCGSGAFTIGAAKLGYESLGLSWDTRNQAIAAERALLCNAPAATFQIVDVRRLDEHPNLSAQYDIAVCLETIEHILDDRKLLGDISKCLKEGGRLLLTTPNVDYRSITKEDDGPFFPVENGWHVRKGYSEHVLRELCDSAGLRVVEISYCSGFTSQKVTAIMRILSKRNRLLGWLTVCPLRLLPPVIDPVMRHLSRWPDYSICLEAEKK